MRYTALADKREGGKGRDKDGQADPRIGTAYSRFLLPSKHLDVVTIG